MYRNVYLSQEDMTSIERLTKALNKAFNGTRRVTIILVRMAPNTLRDLNWDIVEIIELLQLAANFKDTLKTVRNHNQLKPELMMYLRKLYKKRRGPAATHVLVIMLSDERRNTKPYALPIQFIPYHSLTC